MNPTPTSLGDLLRGSIKAFPTRTAMQIPDKKTFSAITYSELGERVRRYVSALQGLGVKRGDRVCIVADNGCEWAFTDWACQCLGVIVVPIYPTLPPDQTEYMVRDCGAQLVVAGGPEQLAKTECMEGVRTILLKGGDSLDERARAGEAMPLDAWNREIDQTRADEVCTIIYTSGTTGLPKGAMLSHRAFIHVCWFAKDFVHLNENDVFLGFLPMSHVFERVGDQILPIYLGASIAYSKNLVSLGSEMTVVRPTVMLCVPRFLESLQARVLDAMEKAPPFRRKMFDLALAQGTKRARGEFAPLFFLTDKLVGAKIREKVGGRLRFFVSGGAALPTHVAEFYMAMGLTILQGYGLTETTGGTCVNSPDRNKYWTVGESFGMDIKIAEDGEVLIKGPALMEGYYNLPEETAQAIDTDGYFHTGDIGEFEGNNLKITDRKKDLIVLGNGKNVAPQPIENKLKSSPLIQEAVVFGDGMDSCVALLIPNPEIVRHRLETLPADADLATQPEVRALLKKEVDAVNKTLAPFEQVKRYALLSEPFTIESGELTPTLKVKRRVVREKFSTVIDGLR